MSTHWSESFICLHLHFVYVSAYDTRQCLKYQISCTGVLKDVFLCFAASCFVVSVLSVLFFNVFVLILLFLGLCVGPCFIICND